ncbi:hypothetical protein D9M73_253710 [compost metagenome]
MVRSKALEHRCEITRGIVIRNAQADAASQFLPVKGRLGLGMQVEHSPRIAQ